MSRAFRSRAAEPGADETRRVLRAIHADLRPNDHAYLADSILKLAQCHRHRGDVGRAAELQAESEAVRKQQ